MPAPAGAAAPIRLGAPHPYLKTHGAKVARLHMVDWIVLLLLAAADVGLNLIEPFHRFVGKGMKDTLLRLGLPATPPSLQILDIFPLPVLIESSLATAAGWMDGWMQVIAVAMPMLIFAGIYVKRKNAYDLHHAILGLLFSVLITGVLTDAIKDSVGRPRPNFFWRCFPDGVPNYNNITGQVICHGEAAIIKEGHKSFPSGHTSWSFAGLSFLSWYLAGKIRVFDQQGHIAKPCIVISPLLLAAMIGVSRVDDYWHHWQDVFAGGILGLVVASFCYLQFFPSPYVRAEDVHPTNTDDEIISDFIFFGDHGLTLTGHDASLLVSQVRGRHNYTPPSIVDIVGKTYDVTAEVNQDTYDKKPGRMILKVSKAEALALSRPAEQVPPQPGSPAPASNDPQATPVKDILNSPSIHAEKEAALTMNARKRKGSPTVSEISAKRTNTAVKESSKALFPTDQQSNNHA